MIDTYLNRYQLLKDKYKSIARTVDTLKEIVNNVTTMFKWSGADDMIPPFQTSQWIEYYLLKDGIIALGKIEGELTFARGNLGDGLSKRFGLPEKFIYFTNGGLSGEWTIGKDCVVFLANPAAYPDYFTIDRYSDMLANVDLSIECMLIYSRDIAIPLCMTDNERSEIEKAIDQIRKGKMSIVKSFDVSNIKTLDITRPEMIQYMTNYNALHDELIKRVYLHFGIMVETKDKKAQITTQELDALSQVAGSAFYTRYELRRKSADWANKLFGCRLSVEPGEYFDDLSNGRNSDFAEGAQQEGGNNDEVKGNNQSEPAGE